MINYYH